MPTYGYQCTKCQHEFSVFQAMKDAPLTDCPNCDGKIKRLLYPVGIVFKGSGWYVNDSRKPDTSDAPPAVKADDGKSEGDKSDSSKPETKPDGKTESGTKETPSTSGESKTEAPAAPAASTK